MKFLSLLLTFIMIVCTTTFIAAEEKPIGSIEDFSELTIPSSDDPIQVGRILGLLGGEPQQGNLGIVWKWSH